MTKLTGIPGLAEAPIVPSGRTERAAPFARMRRILASLVLVAATFATLPDAHAQRAFARRFPAAAAQPLNVEGDIVLIGNVNLTCPTGSTSTDPGAATCASVQAGANGRNNGFTMAAVNVDADGTNTNSSIATLNLPSGANVLFAGLYWGAVQATASARTTVRFKVPGSGYSTITASTVDAIGTTYQSFADVTTLVRNAGNGAYTVGNIGQTAGGGNWSGWTLVVAYQKTGAQLRNLSVFDGLQQGNGTNTQFDISISGFYTPPTGTVNSNIGFVLYDGDRGQNDDAGGAPSLQFGKDTASLSPVFDAINPVADFWNSSISFEGANVTAGRTPAYTNLLGVDIDDVKPNTPLPNGSTTAVARFRASANDVNYPGVITLATDVFEPEIVTSFVKTATNANGTGTFRPGDTVTYTIDLQNRGNDNAQSVVVTDPLPAGVTYVPNSLVVVNGPNAGAKSDGTGDDQASYDGASRTVTFRLGTGATSASGGVLAPTQATRITFQVTIDANQANGASISNQANVNYVSATSGTSGSGSTPASVITVTNQADVSIAFARVPAAAAPNTSINYDVVVSSAGPSAANGATVTYDVPNALTGVTITCAATGGAVCPSTTGLTDLTALAIPTLPNGGAVTFTITGTTPASGTLASTATTATPSGVSDPTPANNTANAATTIQPPTDLAVTTTVATAGPYRAGQNVTYTIVVNNATSVDAINAALSDTLPAGTTFVSLTTPAGWSATTPAVGAGGTVSATNPNQAANTSATFTLVVQVGGSVATGTTITDTATVSTATPDSNSANDSSSASFTVSSTIDAVDDVRNAMAGGTAAANVLLNDSLAGATPTTSTVILTQVSTTDPGITLNTSTGAVTVANGTAAGTYVLVYRICETAVPSNCDTANVTVTVGAGVIDAVPDTGSVTTAGTGGTAVANVLANDMLGATPATTSNVTISLVSSSNPGVTLDATTGAVNVATTVPAGNYSLLYQICETAVPTNCDTAAVSVPVSAGAIVANDDTGSAVTAGTGGTSVPNVLVNDTLAGAPATTSNVTLSFVSSTNAGITLNTSTGAVTVSAAVPAGSYTLTYQVCETATPANCDTATVTVPVSAGAIVANDDAGAVVVSAAGGTSVANVLVNDTLGGAATTTSNVTLSQVSSTNAGVTLDTATGAVNVAPGTPAGTYTLTYQICETAAPSNCDTATVTVPVSAGAIVANNDTGSAGPAGGTAVPNVLANDTLGGAPATTSNVTLSQVSSTSPAISLDPATGAVNVAPNTPAGTYTLTYQICETATPANCTTATVTVTVQPAALVANNDTGSAGGAAGGTAVPNVLANDTVDGAPATLSNVTLSQVSTTNPGVTLDPSTGAVNVAPNTPAGTYTVTYQICETLNPTNCTTATVTVTVTAATLVANNDSGSAGGAAGGTAVPNVLVNDTVNGSPATLSNVTLTQVSTTNPGVTLDPSTGAVNVAPNTPAGTYTVTYQICETLNPTNCTTATVTVTATAGALVANNDTGSVGGAAGGAAVPNVLANDTVNGAPATLSNVTLTQVSTSNPGVTLDPSTGAVNVAPNTPAGTYTLTYQICEQLNPTNCTTATVTVTVNAATLVANNDSGSAGGSAGGTAVPNVLVNDTINGAPATLSNVTLSQVSTTNPGVTLDPSTGAVNVAPNTPAGTYTVTYRICEQLNPTNCTTATATITVTAAVIDAVNDTAGPVEGGAGATAVVNVLGNDTLGGSAATTSNVTVTPTTNGPLTLNANGTVDVAPNTPAGTYTLNYTICEQLNPTNCDTATVTVTVTAAVIDAVNDTAGPVEGSAGATAIVNVLGNDTLGGSAATTSNVTVTPTTNGPLTLNTNGTVDLAPNTPAGTYTLNYTICQQLNPSNCDSATVTVTVTAAVIDAVNDSAGPVDGSAGATGVINVLGNDTLNGAGATTANVTVTPTTNGPLTLNANGTVDVAPNTPAGTYTLNYTICQQLNPSNCDTATVTVTVSAAPIAANDDAPPAVVGATGGTAIPNVLVNDTLGSSTPTLATVTLTQVSTSNPAVTLDTSTGAVNVAPGTPAGTYTLVYRICQQLNPTNCDTATVTVVVSAAVIDAVNDTTPPVNGVAGTPNAVNVLGNDTLNGAAATTSNVTLSQVSTTNPGVTLDPSTGNVAVAAGTPAGTYTLTYRICELINPTNCDTATVTVNVVAPAIVANDDTGTTPQNTPVAITVLGNDTLGGGAVANTAVNVTIVAQPTHGTVVVNANGTITYTPATNYSGPDSFVYRICDRVNPTVCDDATVAITVTGNTVDAVDRTLTTPQTGPVVIDPLQTTINGGGAPLDPGSVQIVTPPTNGTAVVNPNGTIAYTPNPLFFGVDTFRYRICDRSTPTPVCDTATVTINVAMQAPQLRLTKTVPSRAVKVGDLVRYTVVVENTGIAPANNATVVDTPPQGFTFVEGSLSVDDADDRFVLAGADPIRINGIDVPVGGRATIVYVLRVGAGVGRGTHTNQVTATDATGTSISNTATADVTVEGDPTMDDALILGTVFLDTNGDGVQQAGEPGLPGVRLASVEGLVIETDVHGRYHVAGITPSNAIRGSNFVLKVDAATLPPGSTFTTANPLVRRITPGVPVRFDFGVKPPPGDDATGLDATR